MSPYVQNEPSVSQLSSSVSSQARTAETGDTWVNCRIQVWKAAGETVKTSGGSWLNVPIGPVKWALPVILSNAWLLPSRLFGLFCCRNIEQLNWQFSASQTITKKKSDFFYFSSADTDDWCLKSEANFNTLNETNHLLIQFLKIAGI